MIDISGINYFLPVISFALAFVIIFAILKKTGILGDSAWICFLVSFAIALVFASFPDVRTYMEAVTPWFVILIILLFFILLIGAFALAGDVSKIVRPGLVWVLVAILAFVFIFIGYNHFDVASNCDFIKIKDFLFDRKISGGLAVLIVALIVGFIVAKK